MKNLRLIPIIVALAASLTLNAQPQKDTTLTIKESYVVARKNAPGLGAVHLSGKTLEDLPSFLGETDPLKGLQFLPGVVAGAGGSSGLLIRGGGPDENLLLLDGVPMCTAGHLLGIFSVFQGEAASDITLRKGYFPARYGGRTSGIVDLRTIEGDMNGHHGVLGAGLISDKIHLDGPLANGKASYSISGRGMHTMLLDGVVRALGLSSNYYFSDLHSKVTFRPSGKDRLEASVFRGKDDLRYSESHDRATISWGNEIVSASWDRSWSGSLRSETVLYYSGYGMDVVYKGQGVPKETYSTGIRNLSAKADFHWATAGGHDIRFGAGHIRHAFLPDDGQEAKERVILKGSESHAYFEDRLALGRHGVGEAGARLVRFASGGKSWWSLEPRISVTQGLGKGVSVQGAYSRMSQYIHLLSPTQVVLPVDIWLPVTNELEPLRSDEVTLGIRFEGAAEWEFSLEGYLKRTSGVVEYKDSVALVDDFRKIGESVSSGLGFSKGVELLARKTEGRLTGWAAYTLSKSERKFPDGSINGGRRFPYRYDCTHNISLVMNFKVSRRWDVGATWVYLTGGAVSLPAEEGAPVKRGSLRLPPTHRLDLAANFRKEKRRGERVWSVGLYNAYNRKNPTLVFQVNDGEDGPGSLKIISILPVLPSVSYSRSF